MRMYRRDHLGGLCVERKRTVGLYLRPGPAEGRTSRLPAEFSVHIF